MNPYKYPTILPDKDDTLAVVFNTDRMMAIMTGHERVAEINISMLAVMINFEATWSDQVGDGKYRSAVFARFESGLEKVPGMITGQYELLEITEELKARLIATMGQTVWKECQETKGEKHSFMWNVMHAPTDGTAFIRLTWA